MATGGSNITSLLTRSDDITGRLLSHVSLHVRPETGKQFATGPLGLRENQFDLIAADFPQQSRKKEKINAPTYTPILNQIHRNVNIQ